MKFLHKFKVTMQRVIGLFILLAIASGIFTAVGVVTLFNMDGATTKVINQMGDLAKEGVQDSLLIAAGVENPEEVRKNMITDSIKKLSTTKDPTSDEGELVDKVFTLFELTGVFEKMPNVIEQAVEQAKRLFPALPSEYFVRMEDKFNDKSAEMIAEMAYVYIERFTAEEIDDLIEFSKSKTGKRVLSELPDIRAKFQLAGEKMSMEVVQEIEAELNEEKRVPTVGTLKRLAAQRGPMFHLK